MAALPGLLGDRNLDASAEAARREGCSVEDMTAIMAYSFADAMMAARLLR